MTDFFFDAVLRSSLYGSIVIAVVFLLRLLLKPAPKAFIHFLWLLVIVRLLCPASFESSFSLLPDTDALMPAEPQAAESTLPAPQLPDLAPESNLTVQAADTTPALPDWKTQNVPSSTPVETTPETVPEAENPVRTAKPLGWKDILTIIWCAGAGAMVFYFICSYLRLRKTVWDAVRIRDNIYESTRLDTAFVLGFLRPRIYLPVDIESDTRRHLIAHEKSHIARLDHICKLLGYAALAMHWFNPLVWLFYIFLCRDIEMACDERVIRTMDAEGRKAYSMALLVCSSHRSSLAACPVAFAEDNIRQRILRVLNYRKPGFWITVLSVIAVIFVAVCFLTSPKTDPNETLPTLDYTTAENYTSVECGVYEDCSYTFLFANGAEQITVNGNTYLFEPEIPLEDRIRFIESQEALLELLPDIRNCSFMVLPNYESRSDSADNAAYYGLNHTATWHQALVTIGLLEGDYVNYGYAYAKADDLSRQLSWERDIGMAGTPINAVTETPELLNLVYPCFTAPYATDAQIAACKMLALEIYADASRDTEEAFLAQILSYAAKNGIAFTPTSFEFAFNGEYCPMKMRTEYMEIYISATFTEDSVAALNYTYDWTSSVPLLLDALEFQESEIREINEALDYVPKAPLPLILSSFTSTSETEPVASIECIEYCCYKYLIHAYMTCYNPDGTGAMNNPLGTLIGYYYIPDLEWRRYVASREIGAVAYGNGLDRVLGREVTGPEDEVYAVECWLKTTLDFDADPMSLIYYLNSAQNTFGNYLVNLYGEDIFVQIMLDTSRAEVLTGKSYEQLVADWLYYLQYEVQFPETSPYYTGNA